MGTKAPDTDLKPKKGGWAKYIMLTCGVIFLLFTGVFCISGFAVTTQDAASEALVPFTCMGIFTLGSGVLLIFASRRLGAEPSGKKASDKEPEPEKRTEGAISIPSLEQVELLQKVDEVKVLQKMSVLVGIAAELTALRSTISGYSQQYPRRSMMGGPGVAQAEKQIPWIVRTLKEAAEALTTGKDPFDNPITVLETRNGLAKLVSMVSDPEYLTTLDLIYEGIANPLENSMQDLEQIIERIPT